MPTARLIPSISPLETAELTFHGSEVIHPQTMKLIIDAQIPIRIKNITNPASAGTVIMPVSMNGTAAHHASDKPTFSRSRSHAVSDAPPPRRPTAVTIKRSVIILNLRSNKRTSAHGFLSQIFQALDRHHLSVDLIASSELHVSAALHSERPMISGLEEFSGEDDEDPMRIDDERLRHACDDLGELGDVNIVTDMAIISLVGEGLKKMVGICGRFFAVLGDNGINIEMISQGMQASVPLWPLLY